MDPFLEWHIERVVLSFGCSCFFQVTCPWEEIAIPMEGDCHHAVGRIECFFNSISMVHVDVDVKHTVVVFEELKDCEHDIVDVAETRSFLLLGMVKASRPVDCNVC